MKSSWYIQTDELKQTLSITFIFYVNYTLHLYIPFPSHMALYFVVKKWDLSFTSLVTAHLVFPDDWLETWSLCLFQHCTLDSKIAMDIKDLNWIGQKKTFLRKYGVFVSFQNVPMFFRRSVNLYTVSTCQQWLKNLIFFFPSHGEWSKGIAPNWDGKSSALHQKRVLGLLYLRKEMWIWFIVSSRIHYRYIQLCSSSIPLQRSVSLSCSVF